MKGKSKRKKMGREVRELDRRYVEGYRKKPEDTAWAETAAKLISRVLRREER